VTLSSTGGAVITADADGRVMFLHPVAEFDLVGRACAANAAAADPLPGTCRLIEGLPGTDRRG
jgi:hypothetical protein